MVISHYAIIGDDVQMRHNVTIGGRLGAKDAPTIGDRVNIAPGAVIIGEISVGDGAKIGPNAVVYSNVPAGGSVVAPAAEIRGVQSAPQD